MAWKLDHRLLDIRSKSKTELRQRGYRAAVAAGQPEPRVELWVRLAPGVSRADMLARYPDSRFGKQVGRLLPGEVPVAYLDLFEGDPDIEDARAAVLLKPLMNVVRSSHQLSGPNYLGVVHKDYTNFGTHLGDDVVIGIVDTGIDWDHADFVTEGAPDTSRILFIWDQSDTGGSPGPPGGAYTYGTQWTQAHINDEIDGFPASFVRQQDTDGHGTHVAGIAAGDGTATGNGHAANRFVGMAPNADIIMVKTTWTDPAIVDGVNYIIDKAASLGKRAVINLSLGGHAGPHDGTSYLDTALGQIAASTPVIVAMGNEQQQVPHVKRTWTGTETETFQIQRYGSTEYLQAEFWFNSTDRYSVTASNLPSGGDQVTANDGNYASGTIGTSNVQIWNATHTTNSNGHLNVFIQLDRNPTLSDTNFYIKFQRTVTGGNGRVDGYNWYFDYSSFTTHVDWFGTIGEPATANNVISVASFCGQNVWKTVDAPGVYNITTACPNLGEVSTFSSRGPTRDGRDKPEITAPGQMVGSARSTDYTPGTGELEQDGVHMMFQGTSMATPVVAGAVALKLQNDESLIPAQIKSALQTDAQADTKVTAWGGDQTSVWGPGKLQIKACGDLLSAPGTPTALTLGASSITWSWTNVPGASSYNVYYATSPSTQAGSVSGSPFTWTSLLANTTYGIKIAAVNDCGSSSLSAGDPSTSTLSTALGGVDSLDVEITSITANYTNLPAAPRESSSFGYILDASTAANFTGTVISSVTDNSAQASLRLDGLTGYTTYYLRLGTLNENSAANYVSAGSTFTNTSLVSPGAAAFTNLGTDSIQANWTLTTNPPGLLYRAEGATAADFSGTVLSSETYNLHAVFGSLTINTTYYFRVKATTGPPTLLGSTVTLTLPPASASPAYPSVYLTSMTYDWTSGGNPAGVRYIVDVSSDEAFSAGVASSNTANTLWALTALQKNTSYYARVYSLNHAGAGSAVVSAATATLTDPPLASGTPFPSVSSSMTVQWVALPTTPPPSSCHGYVVEASTAEDFSGSLSRARTSDPAATTLSLAGLIYDTTYYVRVGAVNYFGVPNFISIGSTKTAVVVESSDSITNNNTVTVSVNPPVNELTVVEVAVPPNTLPAGTLLIVNASIDFSFATDGSNQADLTPLSNGAGVDITAEGWQPNGPVTIRMVYDPAYLPAGVQEEQLIIAHRRDGSWTILPTIVDQSANVLIAQTRHFSLFAPFAVSAAATLDAINVFPSPWMIDSGGDFDNQTLMLTNLPANGKVRIFTLFGELVWETTTGASGVVHWDGRNTSGHSAASGTYLAVISGVGSHRVKRVVIAR